MLTASDQKEPSRLDTGSTRIWTRRLIILLTILAALALAVAIFSAISHITTSVLVVVIAAFIAYAIAPVVEILHKIMPRALAILLTYLIVFSIIGVISYSVVSTAIFQIEVLVKSADGWLRPENSGSISLLSLLLKLGLTQAQINALVVCLTSS
jgi:predicted PurR-regulated permease PerM